MAESQEKKEKDPNDAPSSKEKKEEKKRASNDTPKQISFNKNIEIMPGHRLEHLDRGPVKAYRAEGKKSVAKSLVAFVCENHLIPRWQEASNYATIVNPNIAKLVATGATYWPPSDGERFIFVFENNFGNIAFPPPPKLAYGLKQELVMEQLIRPVINVLRDFQDKGYVHGGIRLDNFYDGGSTKLNNIILGEALTTPCSYLQTALFEPLERAMADPISRGLGTFADDLYSFGVVLTVLFRTNDPMDGFTDKQIIEEKIEKGTYAALTGKDRFTGAVLELLRGILHDDKTQRWTVEEAATWMDGRRLSPKQGHKRKKASRIFHLGGNRYSRPELIAYDSEDHATQIVQVIDDGKLEQWLDRSLEDEDMSERLETAAYSAKEYGTGDSYQYSLLSRVSIALDPNAPIRYKGLNLKPDGYAAALAEAFSLKKDLNPFVDIIDQSLVMFWLNSQTDKTVDYGSISSKFESCRAFTKNQNMGFGLERCLYFLFPEAPCLSDKLKDYYIKSPEELVIAFEDMIEKGEKPSLFLDRHSIAYLSVRDSKILDAYLIELNSNDKAKNILGNIWTLQNIQARYNLAPLPNIAAHIVEMMGPVLERFHDKNLRDRLDKEFNKIKKQGDLSRIGALLDNAEIVEKDFSSFKKGMKDYARLKKEKDALEKKLQTNKTFGEGTGQNIAAMCSAFLGGSIIIIIAFYKLSEAGLF